MFAKNFHLHFSSSGHFQYLKLESVYFDALIARPKHSQYRPPPNLMHACCIASVGKNPIICHYSQSNSQFIIKFHNNTTYMYITYSKNTSCTNIALSYTYIAYIFKYMYKCLVQVSPSKARLNPICTECDRNDMARTTQA